MLTNHEIPLYRLYTLACAVASVAPETVALVEMPTPSNVAVAPIPVGLICTKGAEQGPVQLM